MAERRELHGFSFVAGVLALLVSGLVLLGAATDIDVDGPAVVALLLVAGGTGGVAQSFVRIRRARG